jgi:hypothetical protein
MHMILKENRSELLVTTLVDTWFKLTLNIDEMKLTQQHMEKVLAYYKKLV